MRFLRRPALDARWARNLAAWTASLEAVTNRSERYTRCMADWRKRRSRTRTVREVRAGLEAMNGRLGTHCMYCEYNEAAHIDHFEPRARAPERTFDWENLFLACDLCDGRKLEKYEEVATGLIPACPTDATSPPETHLRFLSTGAAQHLTDRGRWTREVFDLDREPLRQLRRDRWEVLVTYLLKWDGAMEAGDTAAAERHRDLVRRPPFLSVLRDLLAAALSANADILGLADVADVLLRRPEVATWPVEDGALDEPDGSGRSRVDRVRV